MVVEAVSGGLIAAGAFLLVPSLLAPIDRGALPEVEADRHERNADVAKWLSAISTLAGAALLLAVSSPVWAVPALGGVLIVYYLALVLRTRRVYVQLAQIIRRQLDTGEPIGLNFGPELGLPGVDPGDEMAIVASKVPMPDHLALQARAVADERASWRWLLRYPLGSRDGRGL